MKAMQCLLNCLVVWVCASCSGIRSVKTDLNIMDFVAMADGKSLCTKAIQSAIDECSQRGGRLVFPAGVYLTGTFYIKAGVELHLKKGAVILGSTNINDYATDTGGIRYDNTPWMDRCLIYAEKADNISITGAGTLDGNGTQEHFPPGRAESARPMLLRIVNCRNVVFRDFRLRNPASWGCSIIGCENVDIRNLNIHNRSNWNGDGLDFDSCRNVTVDNCEISASDDAICLQASEADRPCEDIRITNCRLSSRWSAIRIGLLTRSDIRNVKVSDCHLHDIDDCGFKLQMAEGAVMENMRFENITMEHVTRPVFMTLNSHRFCRSLRDVPLPPPGKVRNIQFINIKATAGNPAVKDGMAYMAIMGVPGQKLEDIEFRNVDITFPGGGTEETARRRDVPELGDWKPEFFSFKGDLPAYGLYISHAKGITLNHVKFRLKSIEKRPAILCDDVEDFNAPDLEAQGQDGVGPVAPEVPLTTAPLYQEQYRPQFHFSSVTNWLNDPNGLVFYKGEYHLFFQHNPKRNVWGNMTWGHAVSPDLVHWTQLDPVIYPDKLGTIFSGSAVVDWKNTSGFGKEGVPPLVCIYTSNGQPATQSIAYSLDGRTFTKYEKNPVLGNVARGNRDPKVVWHESSKQWIMILFVQSFDLFSSPNLKDWTPLPTKIECGRECPDIFPMPLDGDPEKLKWVVTAASGSYIIGEFDGKEFKTEVGPFPSHFGYAVQTFSDEPKGRRIQIGWLRGTKVPYPGMPFNQQMTVPAELTLKTTPNGPRLFRLPVKELEVLRGKVHAWTDTTIVPGTNLLSGLTHDLYDIEGEIQAGSSKEVGFKARGKPVSLHFVDGRAKFRMLVDRITIEVFEDDGAKTQAMTFMPDDKAAPLDLFAVGGNAKIVSLKVHELKSIWK